MFQNHQDEQAGGGEHGGAGSERQRVSVDERDRLPGQSALNRQLRMGTFAALGQRIATRFTIKPMGLAGSAACLRRHLAPAGGLSSHRRWLS